MSSIWKSRRGRRDSVDNDIENDDEDTQSVASQEQLSDSDQGSEDEFSASDGDDEQEDDSSEDESVENTDLEDASDTHPDESVKAKGIVEDTKTSENPEAKEVLPSPLTPSATDKHTESHTSEQQENKLADETLTHNEASKSYTEREKLIMERREYRRKLAEDPSFTPNVGFFWSHDDRFRDDSLQGSVIQNESTRRHSTKEIQFHHGDADNKRVNRRQDFGRVPVDLLNQRWTHDGYEELLRLEEQDERDKRERLENSERNYNRGEHGRRGGRGRGRGRGRGQGPRRDNASDRWRNFNASDVHSQGNEWPELNAKATSTSNQPSATKDSAVASTQQDIAPKKGFTSAASAKDNDETLEATVAETISYDAFVQSSGQDIAEHADASASSAAKTTVSAQSSPFEFASPATSDSKRHHGSKHRHTEHKHNKSAGSKGHSASKSQKGWGDNSQTVPSEVTGWEETAGWGDVPQTVSNEANGWEDVPQSSTKETTGWGDEPSKPSNETDGWGDVPQNSSNEATGWGDVPQNPQNEASGWGDVPQNSSNEATGWEDVPQNVSQEASGWGDVPQNPSNETTGWGEPPRKAKASHAEKPGSRANGRAPPPKKTANSNWSAFAAKQSSHATSAGKSKPRRQGQSAPRHDKSDMERTSAQQRSTSDTKNNVENQPTTDETPMFSARWESNPVSVDTSDGWGEPPATVDPFVAGADTWGAATTEEKTTATTTRKDDQNGDAHANNHHKPRNQSTKQSASETTDANPKFKQRQRGYLSSKKPTTSTFTPPADLQELATADKDAAFAGQPWDITGAGRDDAWGHGRFIQDHDAKDQESDVEIILDADSEPPSTWNTDKPTSSFTPSQAAHTKEQHMQGNWRRTEGASPSMEHHMQTMTTVGPEDVYYYPGPWVPNPGGGYMPLGTSEPVPLQHMYMPYPMAMQPADSHGKPAGSGQGGYELNGMVYYGVDPSTMYPYYYYPNGPMPNDMMAAMQPPPIPVQDTQASHDGDEGWGPEPSSTREESWERVNNQQQSERQRM